MNIDPHKLGEAVAALRRTRGLTQGDLAARLDVTANYISLLENGHRGITIPLLNQLAHELKVPAACLTVLGSELPRDEDFRKLLSSLQKLAFAAVDLVADRR